MLGIAKVKLFTDLTDDEIDEMIDTNLKSVLKLTREVIRSMIQNKEGQIINISSVWGITGGSCEVHYSAAKARYYWFYKELGKRSRTLSY